MDYRLRRQVIAIVCLLILGILAIVVAANWRSVKRKLTPSSTSPVSTEEVAVEEVETSSSRNVFVGDNPEKWKSDDDFFDGNKIISTAETVSNEMRTLTISVNSVCKDLRISIYGYGHVLHTGEEFTVYLKNLDNPMESMEVKDSDKDGIIYIDELEPVEYAVSLEPTGGFIVPANSTRVKVKDQLEKKKIFDIDLIIKEEGKLLSRVEDTRYYTASEDASEDMLDDLTAVEYGSFGVEVSSKDEDVDFDTLYNEGIRFVMIRAGYRGARTGAIYIDPYFVDYVSMAKRAGLEVGVYFFTQAIDEKEAVEEASALISLCEDMFITFPYALVVDSAGGDGRADELKPEERTAICAAFAETLKNEGLETMIYASKDWLENQLEASKLEKYGIWVGDLKPVPEYEGFYDLWEYTDSGYIKGIHGDARFIVDMRK